MSLAVKLKLYIILGIIGIAIVSGMIGYQSLSSDDNAIENNDTENTSTVGSDYEFFTIGTIASSELNRKVTCSLSSQPLF